MINAILPIWRKEIQTIASREFIVHNFNREIENAYWIFAANQNDKDFYGTFLGDEIIIKKKSASRMDYRGAILKCKLRFEENVTKAKVTIGIPFWELIFILGFLYLCYSASVYFAAFLFLAFAIFGITSFIEFRKEMILILENVILKDNGLPNN